MDALVAKAVLTLWASSLFDTCDIADLLRLPEADVLRVVRAGRDVVLLTPREVPFR